MAGMIVVALWAFAEAIVLFIVADVPISALALRHGWKAGWRAAGLAAVCAAFGGLLVIAWARTDPAGARETIAALPGISSELTTQAADDFRSGGWLAMLAGSFSGTPYKLYALAAESDGSGLPGFFVTSIFARLPRFLLVAAVFSATGSAIRHRLPSWLIAVLFALGWSLFYAWYFMQLGALP
ncbi:MAG: hypothetical protein KDE25_10590 [Novosphingobium sp.]|nr:hypothetical protein [Novosphingobium sp.]